MKETHRTKSNIKRNNIQLFFVLQTILLLSFSGAALSSSNLRRSLSINKASNNKATSSTGTSLYSKNSFRSIGELNHPKTSSMPISSRFHHNNNMSPLLRQRKLEVRGGGGDDGSKSFTSLESTPLSNNEKENKNNFNKDVSEYKPSKVRSAIFPIYGKKC